MGLLSELSMPGEIRGHSGAVATPDVLGQLQRILASPTFRKSFRMIRFLRIVVEHALTDHAGHQAGRLKEYTIGVEVFDRKANFDPRMDSIVRVEARRLRRKLREYYQTYGREDPIVIELEQGGYRAVFRPREAAEAQAIRKDFLKGGQTVAVLPFVDLTGNRGADQFCRGLEEDLGAAFTKLMRLRTVPPRSTQRFKEKPADLREIGKRLNAAVICDGTVRRRAGERLRVNVHLISARDGLCVWSDTYERSARDPFTTQEELSRQIVQDIAAHFGAEPAPRESGRKARKAAT